MVYTRQLSILLVNAVYIAVFGITFIIRGNYEFITYVGLIVTVIAILLYTNKSVHYSSGVLWGLTLWSCMHFAGGGIFVNGHKLYTLLLIPLTDNIFRYDQLVHIIGFYVGTILLYEIVSRALIQPVHHWVAVGIVIVMAGLGLGALNEIIEFSITLIVPETGVGGYVNTALDLVSDLIGSLLAFVVLWQRERRSAR